MWPHHFKVRFGDVVASVWSKEPLSPDKNYRFVISSHGLPSHPYQHNPSKLENLLEKGFVIVFPNYVGTWASYGRMSWEGCVETILQTIEFIQTGQGESLYDETIFSWEVEDIILLGGSFGASIALVAGAKSDEVKNIIAIAGPTDWRDHSRIPEEAAEPIADLYNSIQRGWENLWRIPSREEWQRLVDGTADINPIDYVSELMGKNVLLIHGEADPVVSVKRSIDLNEKLKEGTGKHELLILEGHGHISQPILGEKSVLDTVLSFLS